MDPISDHPLDDLAAYALTALDDAERQAVDDHLAHCLACRAELAGHHETLAALTGDQEAPPSAVWQTIAAGIGAPDLPGPHTGGPTQSSPVASGKPEPGHLAAVRPADRAGPGVDPVGTIPPPAEGAHARARGPRLRWLAAVACLVVTATAGGVVGFALGTSGDDSADIGSLAERASDESDGVLGTLADPGGQPVVRVVADEDGAYVVLEGMQDLPEGQAYQLWSLDGPQPVSLGMLGREGTNTVAFRLPPTITELAITVEPTSGEVTPSGELQASGRITHPT